jgi:hypothetical protein
LSKTRDRVRELVTTRVRSTRDAPGRSHAGAWPAVAAGPYWQSTPLMGRRHDQGGPGSGGCMAVRASREGCLSNGPHYAPAGTWRQGADDDRTAKRRRPALRTRRALSAQDRRAGWREPDRGCWLTRIHSGDAWSRQFAPCRPGEPAAPRPQRAFSTGCCTAAASVDVDLLRRYLGFREGLGRGTSDVRSDRRKPIAHAAAGLTQHPPRCRGQNAGYCPT